VIDAIDWRRQDRHAATAGIDRGEVRLRVDPEREAADDGYSCASQLLGDLGRRRAAVSAGAARPDDRHAGP